MAILFSKIKEVTKGAGTIQEQVLITPVRYLQNCVALCYNLKQLGGF